MPAAPAELEDLRVELRAWIDEHLPPELVASTGHPAPSMADPVLRAWARALHEAGYATAAWPAEHGGRDASVAELVVIVEELHRAGAPLHPNVLGLHNIAPSIIEWGTAAQQQRFLEPMARADELWCQGFSEPDAGSDMAALSTRAVRDGDCYVVDGQKVWTTGGHVADWCELLVRTDATGSKHHGITCLLVPLDTPGIERRPITTICGGQEFAEMFFDGARVPVELRLGPENEGWRVAMTTLAHERAGVASLYLRVRRGLDRLLSDAKGAGVTAQPLVRQRLASCYIAARVLELIARRALSSSEPGAEGSIVKLFWSDTEQRLAEVAIDVLGVGALGEGWGHELLESRAYTIAGGTSQVNRNIIAERVLGLPKG